MAPLLHLMSVSGFGQLHNVGFRKRLRVLVKLFGLLVTFSKGLLRNHSQGATVHALVRRSPLEFLLNKQCQSNAGRVTPPPS